MFKLLYNCLLHMLARVCSKSFKLSFNSMWTMNFQIYKLGLEKADTPEIKLPTIDHNWSIVGSQRKQGNSRKTSTSASLTMLKPLTVWITTNWKILQEMGIPDQTTWPASWEIYMQVRKQQLELDMEQQTGSKSGKECVKLYTVTLLI